MVRLGDIATVVTGSTPKTSVEEYWNGTNCWITPAELSDKVIVVHDTERKVTDLAISDTSLKPLPIGTVLLSSRAPIGKVAITGCVMYCNQGFKNLVCGERIYNKYLFWFLRGRTEYLNSLGRGVTFKEISKTIVEGIRIPLPPFDIQKHIADTLDKTQEIIDGHKKQLAELDNLIKSVFYEMFGDLILNDMNWELSTVEKVCTDIIGGGTPSKSNPGYYIGNIPWVTPKDMKSIEVFDSIDHINMNAINNSSAKLIPVNSILMVIRSGILKRTLPVAINKVEVAVNQDMKAFIVSDKIRPEYLLFYFIMTQSNILRHVRSVTADNIEFNLIKNLVLPLPPYSIQNKFAEIVTKIEEQKAIVKQAITESENLFNSLMSEYFD